MLKVNFFVVPNMTITCAALLGRDFISSPSVKITLGEKFSISRANSGPNNSADFSKQIFHIYIRILTIRQLLPRH